MKLICCEPANGAQERVCMDGLDNLEAIIGQTEDPG